MFDTMVIPLDGSPFAADALPIGAALARDAGAGFASSAFLAATPNSL